MRREEAEVSGRSLLLETLKASPITPRYISYLQYSFFDGRWLNLIIDSDDLLVNATIRFPN